MTAATQTLPPPLLDPPAIPDSALEPLLGDRERRCEVFGLTGARCPEAASWVVAGCCTHCGPRTGLVCDPCMPDLLATWRRSNHSDGGKVTVTWIESI